MNSLEFNKKLIAPTISGYLELLIQEFKYSTEIFELMQKLFFPKMSRDEIFHRYSNIELVNLNYFKHIETSTYCSFEDLDSIDYKFRYVRPDYEDQYKFFDKQEFSSLEQANASYQGGYFFTKEKFKKIYDEFLLSCLVGFEKRKGKSSVYLKQLGDGITMVLDLKREDAAFIALPTYTFPDLRVRTAEKEHGVIDRTDLASFLLLPSPSFSFFYANSNEFFCNEDGQVIRVSQKKGEPLIYHDERAGIFTISNSLKNLERFNKYIYMVTELFVHYYNFFEIWLGNQIRANLNLLA